MLMDYGDWLRRHREVRGWAAREMARRLVQVAQAAGDTSVPDVDRMCGYVRRWESDAHGLTERYKLYYCTALGIQPGQFGTAAPEPAPAVPALAGPRLPASATVAYRGDYASELGGFMVERELLMTAHEGSDHAEQAGQPGLGEVTFEQLRADVVRLAGLTDTGEPFATFLEMRRVRGRIYKLLDRRLWPREQTDLYFLLGCLNGLMGVAANRLGYPDAAEELMRAGWAYANAIDHHPLLAQLRQQLSYAAYWRGRFEECRDLAANGLTYLSQGPLGAQLYLYQARAAGKLGNAGTARRAIASAHDAREQDYNDDLLEIGGEYAVSPTFHQYLAGAAYAAMRGAEGEAAEELERAVDLYDAGPGPHESFTFSGKPLACIDLAVIRLRIGALDAATAALEPVWSLPSALRISTITTRLAVAREELGAPIFRGSAQAQDLGSQIEEFGRETIVAGLHSLPGGPG
jgi:hypothetical protein